MKFYQKRKEGNKGRMLKGADISFSNGTEMCFKIMKESVSPGILDSKIGSRSKNDK